MIDDLRELQRLHRGMMKAIKARRRMTRYDADVARHALATGQCARIVSALGYPGADVSGMEARLREVVDMFPEGSGNLPAGRTARYTPGVRFFRYRVADRDGYRCRVCDFHIAHAHHIVPLAKGGSDHESNGIMLCPNHHAMAHQGRLSSEYLLALAAGQTSEGDEFCQDRKKWAS